MKINNLDNPIFIFLLSIIVVTTNTISSINFFPILLLGILFMSFFTCLKKRYYYSLTLTILTFTFIELNNGFKIFSITILATFIYLFITPYIKRVLSFNSLNSYIYIAIFYLGIYILWAINNEITAQLNYILLINLLIDLIFFGVLI